MSLTDNAASTSTARPQHEDEDEVEQIPAFSEKDPELWFSLVDHSFEVNNITSEQDKFDQVTKAIQPRNEVKDMIMIILEKPYTALKLALLQQKKQPQDSKAIKLLENAKIEDRKPSQFLTYLKNLGGAKVSEDFIRKIWMKQLPDNLQDILATQADRTLRQVADLADKVSEISKATLIPQVRKVKMATTSDSSYDESIAQKIILEQLCLKNWQQINVLQHEIDVLRGLANYNNLAHVPSVTQPNLHRRKQKRNMIKNRKNKPNA